jgi:hypothetical protein
MFCQKCGKDNRDDANFCNGCGFAMNDFPISNQPKTSSVKNDWWVYRLFKNAVIVVGMVFTVIAISVWYQNYTATRRSPMSNFAAPLVRPTPQHFSYKLTKEVFTVQAGEIKQFRFHIRPEMQNARVVGRFESAGGSRNEIYVALVDEDGLTNFVNGQSFKNWYYTKAVVDSFDIRLGPGRYYIVFSNRFSWFATKSVATNITLECDVQP